MNAPDAPGFAGLPLEGARRALAARLGAGGREPAALDARLLLEHATGLRHADLLRDPHRPLSRREAARLEELAARRLGGEPVSRILGRREFHGLALEVRPGVLDPREDSDAAVRLALRLRPDRGAVRRVLDLGVGSGALLCALLAEYPDALGLGVDLSPAACRAARDNLAGCGFGRRALVAQGDWAQACGGGFDLVVSNPPYIARDALRGLEDEVRLHDPPLALDGGPDGLDAYRAIGRDVGRIMAEGALLVLELGAGDRARVAALLNDTGLDVVGVERDAGGHERALAARAKNLDAKKLGGVPGIVYEAGKPAF